jgi:hypothetical protein
MNNVHEDVPVVFQTRWVLSYLRGPLTREQIATLMAARKVGGGTTAPDAPASSASAPVTGKSEPPLLPPDVSPVYVPVSRRVSRDTPIVYRPAVLGRARLHFVDTKAGLDAWQKTLCLAEIEDEVPADVWESMKSIPAENLETETVSSDGATYAELPIELTRSKSYVSWNKSLKDGLYRDGVITLQSAPAFKQFSKPGETEGDFRARIGQGIREQRDVEIEKLRAKYAPKFVTLQDKLRRAEQRKESEKNQAFSAKMTAAVSLGATFIGGLFSRKKLSSTNLGKAATSVRAATRAAEQSGDVGRAEETIDALKEQQAKLEKDLEAATEAIKESCTVENIALEPYEVRPRKSDITIDQVTLAWLPYTANGEPAWEARD